MQNRDFHQRGAAPVVISRAARSSSAVSRMSQALLAALGKLTRMFLLLNIVASLVLFFLIWWALPQFLRLSQSEAILFELTTSSGQSSYVVAYYDQAKSLPNIFMLGEAANQEITQLDQTDSQLLLRQLVMQHQVLLDASIRLPDVSPAFLDDRWQRWSYYFNHLTNHSISNWRRVLLLHIALNKQQTVKTQAAFTDLISYAQQHPRVGKEQAYRCQLAVINTTGQSGLAGNISQSLEQAGLVVVRVDDVEQPAEQTQIFIADSAHECTTVLDKLGNLNTLNTPQVDAQRAERYRAQIVIWLGTDLLL